MECPRKVERLVGVLEAFSTASNDCFASVRIEETLYQLPLSSRGVLQEDGTILLCANGDRRERLKPETNIVVDLIYDANGENPVTGLWAPKQKPPQR